MSPEVGSAQIVLDANTVQWTHGGHIDGGIWLDLDGHGFPDPGWLDFPLPVLSWWVDAMVPLLDGASTSAEVRFLDGPHAVEIEALSPDAWRVSAIDVRVTRRVVRLSSTVDPRPLLASVIAAADTVLAICRTRGWVDRDSTRLANSLAALRSRVGSIEQ